MCIWLLTEQNQRQRCTLLGGSVISCLESDKHQLESLLSSVFPGKLMLLWTSQFICSVQSLSRVQLLVTPWTAAHQASLSITNSWSLLKLMSIKLVMPSNHLILCHPFLLLPFYLYTGAINLMYKFICK